MLGGSMPVRMGLLVLAVVAGLLLQPLLTAVTSYGGAGWSIVAEAAPANDTGELYNGSAGQQLLCYVNTGTERNVTVAEQGSADSFVHGVYRFGDTVQLDAGNRTYNETVPRGEYGSSMMVLGIADGLDYPGSGGRVSALADAGHAGSLTAVRLGVKTFFDGNSSGIVWYRVDLEWSDDGSEWEGSTVFYNVSVDNETIEAPFQVFFAHGRYVRLNVTMVWTPDSGNTNESHAYILVFVDAIVASCWEAAPQALVEYRVYLDHANATISLPGTANASIDYWYRKYNLGFPVETRLALDTINITDAPLAVDGYNLTFVLDENGNPLPFRVWADGNISVVTPMVNQTVTLVYTREGRAVGARWLPPDGLIWFFDFGDALEQQGTTQGWIGYGRYYETDVKQDPIHGDWSLHTRLTRRVWLSSGGWYMRDLVLPPGEYIAGANIRVEYSYFYFYYGRIRLIFFFREHDGVYRSALLLNGPYTTYDGTVRGNITAEKWGNQVYFTWRSYYSNAGSQTWIRWSFIVGIPSTGYTLSFQEEGHRQENTTVTASGVYYAVLPWFNSTILEKFDANRTTGYLAVKAGSPVTFEMRQDSSVSVALIAGSGVEPGYFPDTIITAPNSTFTVTIEISAPQPSRYILPDPPLAGAPILFVLSDNGTILDSATATSDGNGRATASLATPAEPSTTTLTIAPLAWPYVIPATYPVYVESVVVNFYGPDPIYLRKNDTMLEGLSARYKESGLLFTGTITLSLDKPGITIDPENVSVSSGYGEFLVESGNRSGRYLVTAVSAYSGTLTFPAEGNKTFIVVGARILITVRPEGPPWYVYSSLTWVVRAVYDDGSTAEGEGYIIVEKDHYQLANITWNGSSTAYRLASAGYDNYLRAVLREPLVGETENYSLVVAIPLSGGGSSLGGVELMSFHIETYQMAALKDGVLAMMFIGLTLLPYMLRRYTSLFQGPLGLLIWTAVIFGITLMTMIGRAQIPLHAYVVQTPNGTTIKPEYVDNPFVKAYIAPLAIETMVIFHSIIQLMGEILEIMTGARRWRR